MWINKKELKNCIEAEVRVQVSRQIARAKEVANLGADNETIFHLPQERRLSVKNAILMLMEELGLEFRVIPAIPGKVRMANKEGA